jgi:protein associated with RNAse G/E
MTTSKSSHLAEEQIKVQKKNLEGKVTYEYEGRLLRHDQEMIVIEALFDRTDTPFMDVVLRAGDRFVEYYYTDRWYNIFAIYDREDDRLKGWYCNVGQPAVFEDSTVSYVDLALDLWVSASGEQVVLDEEEFEALQLPEDLRTGALHGLEELKQLFLNGEPPGEPGGR